MSFYVLVPGTKQRFSPQWAFGELLNAQYTHGDFCPVCGAPVNMLRPLPPHFLNLSSSDPAKWGDFLWGAGFAVMVSDRVAAMCEHEGFSGIEIEASPATIVRIGKQIASDSRLPVPRYFMARIHWNGANQDDVASGVISEPPPRCSFCRTGGNLLRQDGIRIESGTWTGLDFFTPRGAPVEILISERVMNAIRNAGLTNACCLPAEQYRYD